MSDSGIVKKRNKATLVCTNCKKKKIKCNRRQPCSSCVRSNVGYSCVYETKWRPVSFDISESNSMHQTISDSNPTTTDINSNSNSKSNSNSNNPFQDELFQLRKKLNDLEASLISGKAGSNIIIDDNSTPNSSTIVSDPSISSEITNNNTPNYNKLSVWDSGTHSIAVWVTQRPSNIPNPIVPDDEIINFYEGYTPIQVRGNVRRINYGPLAWPALIRKDTWLNVMWKFADGQSISECIIGQRTPQMSLENMKVYTAPNPANDSSPEMFKKKTLENDGYNEMVPYKTLAKAVGTKSISSSVNVSTAALAKSLFEGRFNPELQLIEKIKRIMPKKKVIWSLIDQFFSILYGHFPFIDEIDFKKELSKIIGPVSYEDEPLGKVKIERKMDLAHISICLIILRMSYISLFNNRNCINANIMDSSEDSIEKYLFANPINLAVIEVATSCIECFQFSRKSNLTVFQAIFFMRLYRIHAPEEGDGVDGGDSQVATAMLIQMAFSLGLNREPDKFEIFNDERANHLGRKMWHFLVRSDLIHCYSVGNPTTIDMRHFDVKSPFLNEKNSNVSDIDMENAVVETFSYLKDKLFPLKTLLDMVLDINNGSSINKLLISLHDMEKTLTETFYILENDQSNQSNQINQSQDKYSHFFDVVKSKIFISVKISLSTLYYHVYLHYEKTYNSELSYFYIKKMYLIILHDIAPFIFEILYGRFSSDGLILNPTLEMALHKINQINLSTFARVNYMKVTMENKPDHAAKLVSDPQYRLNYRRFVSLSSIVKKCGDLITMVFEKFSTRYYYAWRVYKAHSTLFNYLASTSFYTNNIPGLKKICAFQYSSSQLDEIDGVIHALAKSVSKSVLYEDKIEKVPIAPVAPIYTSKQKHDSPPSLFNVTPAIKTSGNNSVAMTSTTEKSPSNSIKTEIITPHSSIGSPPQDASKTSHEYIDQMWLSMMVMKFDSSDQYGSFTNSDNAIYGDIAPNSGASSVYGNGSNSNGNIPFTGGVNNNNGTAIIICLSFFFL
ncbi:uncharacterized protein RJT21DRAFT_133984 [Scheffersomyces amazonensis]|uniref:uncharacterized protein n=1 Tax=Scheffersomyces amazonensis TaxID=1078765 RepID=UPI00315D9B57